MQVFKQDDYDEFKCIAGKCPSSCCIGWQIVIDGESLINYSELEGPIKDKIDHGIDFKEGVFVQNNRKCAMLSQEGLCELQLACGEDALCTTCKLYPRHIEEYEDVREYTLSLSCPEAARMAVERVEKMTFVEETTDEEDDFEDFDYLLYTKLVDAREKCLEIVQDRDVPIVRRMESIVSLSKEIQACLDDDRIFDIDDLIVSWNKDSGNECLKTYDIRILEDLEMLNDNWKEYIKAGYRLSEKPFEELFAQITGREEIAAEQILTLLIYTYFCGAVYDDWVYSKMALCVYSVYWIMQIYKGLTAKEELEKLIEVTYMYAKEIEHSDPNLNALEEFFMELLSFN